MGVALPLVAQLAERQLVTPTAIQMAAWEASMTDHIVENSDDDDDHNSDDDSKKIGTFKPPLLLHAPTGSGKTLAYLLPSLQHRATIFHDEIKNSETSSAFEHALVVVAPTRELAVQLATDVRSLLPPTHRLDDIAGGSSSYTVALAIAGVELPTADDLASSALGGSSGALGCVALVGTPWEVLKCVRQAGAVGRQFMAAVDAVVLDEADILFPPPPRPKFKSKRSPGDKKASSDDRAKKKKKAAADPPAVKFLNHLAQHNEKDDLQVMAGSATASRQTRDALNAALHTADNKAGHGRLTWRGGKVKPVRLPPTTVFPLGEAESVKEPPLLVNGMVQLEGVEESAISEASDGDVESSSSSRAVSVPSTVRHRFVTVPRAQAGDPQAALQAVTRAMKNLGARSSLLFVCGDFTPDSGSLGGEEAAEKKAKLGKATPKKKRGAKNRSGGTRKAIEKAKIAGSKVATGAASQSMAGVDGQKLSARRCCRLLQDSFGVAAEPLHVALGLATEKSDAREDSADDALPLLTEDSTMPGGDRSFDGEDSGSEFSLDVAATAAASHADLTQRFSTSAGTTTGASLSASPPCLVTFEGTARGLHFDGVDAVFVIGRPSSVSSYLHIAGRVGRLSAELNANSDRQMRSIPGTIVSVCTSGTARELEGWVEQIGGADFSELLLTDAA
eukprot:CAMPEP_0171924172 /NCGR_PEP_ID=MMETSP0993-20121228/22729_1 /TAXON_ID=483369 /ORGANISM="non described non described, Strain CCMP2098" /LENGTH=675 /DNA_ID=CAMNT_0012562357 /DNA_START=74 /DNA_END=2101 /DNA_ORIENTATION=+